MGISEALHIKDVSPADQKLKDTFFDWLLHSIKGDRRQEQGDSCSMPRHWDEVWNAFSHAGTMNWSCFSRVMQGSGKLAVHSRRIYELLCDESGLVTAHILWEERRHYEREFDVHKHKGVTDLKRILLSQFGIMTRAWSLALDPAHNGFCNQTQFVKACKANGYAGDLKHLWEDLTAHRKVAGTCESTVSITYGDVDPENDELLLSFVKRFNERYGDLSTGWYAMLSDCREQQGDATTLCLQFVFPKEFIQASVALGFTLAQGKMIFQLIDIESGADKLTQPEFLFLEMWERRAKSAHETNLNVPQVLECPHQGKNLEAARDFTVIMTKAEHEEYVRRVRAFDATYQDDTLGKAKARSTELREGDSTTGFPGASWARAMRTAADPVELVDEAMSPTGDNDSTFVEVLRQML